MLNYFLSAIRKKPSAMAKIQGSAAYPALSGVAYFYEIVFGVLVAVQLQGLPVSEDACAQPIFAMHIHSGGSCSGNDTDPFANAMTHYNPSNYNHPYHAGDLPPVFGANGLGFSTFLTNRFSVSEIIGKTIILHEKADDFTTQPAGNAGKKIACGVIERFNH